MIKRSRSGSRILAVLEQIARAQPVGVSELARALAEDKSAVQRAIMTLADEGWVQVAPGRPTRWELSAHIYAVANMGHSSNDLRQRARRALELLRDESGESVLLNVPDVRGFVTIDVVESRQMLRAAPPIGTIVPIEGSATGRALLPFMSRERQLQLLGGAPDHRWLDSFEAVREHGYSFGDTSLLSDQFSVAAPVFEADATPIAAIVITGPISRAPAEIRPMLGMMAARTARGLSRGGAPLMPFE